MNLPDGYEIQEMTTDQLSPLREKYTQTFFDDHSQIFNLRAWLSEQEREKCKSLRENMGTPYELHLGLFFKEDFVGWSVGHQESALIYYMMNSAILPEHRRRGLYTALLKRSVEILEGKGFQKIYSRHHATNNAVIIPKLKAGFMITSLEMSDLFGVMVQLSYFPKELRRKMLAYRSGHIRPDEEILNCFKI